MRWSAGLLLALTAVAGCNPCLDKGSNGVPDPPEGMYQLVFSNLVSRETRLIVDGQEAGKVCAETEYATVGNFPVNTHSQIEIRSMVSANSLCHVSPNCDANCGGETCDGDPVIDTTPFSGRKLSTGLVGAAQ